MTTQQIRKRGSLSATTLEQAWTQLRRLIPGLPPAVLLPLDAGSWRRRLGHFAPSIWRARGPRRAHEVAISPRLFESAEELLATLVHEAAHAVLYESDPSSDHAGGVSRDGYYHRREFRDACLQLGIACEFLNGRYGWTLTHWPETGVPARYRRVVEVLRRMPYGAGPDVPRQPTGKRTPPSGQARLECACNPVRAIFLAKSQAARSGIVCRLCASEFAARPTASITEDAA